MYVFELIFLDCKAPNKLILEWLLLYYFESREIIIYNINKLCIIYNSEKNIKENKK